LELVASRLPAYVEALGEHATWVAPAPEAPELADALVRALACCHAPERRSSAAALAARFTWQRNAALTLAGWRSILGLR
jgi:glycosyltransferase involved in cell wall biosynthesis